MRDKINLNYMFKFGNYKYYYRFVGARATNYYMSNVRGKKSLITSREFFDKLKLKLDYWNNLDIEKELDLFYDYLLSRRMDLTENNKNKIIKKYIKQVKNV